MKEIWTLTTADYEKIVALAQAGGCKPGESMQKWFLEYMKENNRKPIGHTELTKDEWLEEVSNTKSVLDIGIDADGKQIIREIKKKKTP